MSRAAKIAIGVIAGIVVVACIGMFAFDRHILNQTYARNVVDSPSLMLTDADIASDYPYEDVEFELDGSTLRGHVYGAENNERGLIVFRHGIYSQHQDYLALITALVDKGWKVLAYDAIGCGESDGDSVLGFAQSPRDVHAAVQFARAHNVNNGLPIVLVGHSWGGYGVAGALDYDDGVEACVTLSGFDAPNEIIMESAVARMGAIASTQAPLIDFIGRLDFGADANRSASRAIDESGIPVLVIHGVEDAVISYDGSSIIAEREHIANPNVAYITKTEENRAGHNSYFYSPESQVYLAACSEKLTALSEKYGSSIPDDVLKEFFDSIDKRRANTADPQLIDEIDAFLAQAVEAKTE